MARDIFVLGFVFQSCLISFRGTCAIRFYIMHLGWMSATYNNVVPLQAVLNKEESHIGSKDVACLQHTTISKTRTRRDR